MAPAVRRAGWRNRNSPAIARERQIRVTNSDANKATRQCSLRRGAPANGTKVWSACLPLRGGRVPSLRRHCSINPRLGALFPKIHTEFCFFFAVAAWKLAGPDAILEPIRCAGNKIQRRIVKSSAQAQASLQQLCHGHWVMELFDNLDVLGRLLDFLPAFSDGYRRQIPEICCRVRAHGEIQPQSRAKGGLERSIRTLAALRRHGREAETSCAGWRGRPTGKARSTQLKRTVRGACWDKRT
jgi:hypothetical protein